MSIIFFSQQQQQFLMSLLVNSNTRFVTICFCNDNGNIVISVLSFLQLRKNPKVVLNVMWHCFTQFYSNFKGYMGNIKSYYSIFHTPQNKPFGDSLSITKDF